MQQNQCPDVVDVSSSLPEATCLEPPQLSQPEILPSATPDLAAALSDVPHCQEIPPLDIPPLDKEAVESMMSSLVDAISPSRPTGTDVLPTVSPGGDGNESAEKR